jgi:hypothetical protein
MGKFFTCIIIAVLAISLSANASLMVNTPSLGNFSIENIGVTTEGYVSIGGGSGLRTATFDVISDGKGLAKWNRMGIYDRTDPLQMLELIARSDKTGDSVMVNFDLATNQAWVEQSQKVSIGSQFGFYLDNGNSGKHGGIYYSDSLLNDDSGNGLPHSMSFGLMAVDNPAGDPMMLVAFDDGKVGKLGMAMDVDFDGVVVSVTSASIAPVPVPEPATVVMLGFGYVFFLGKKK